MLQHPTSVELVRGSVRVGWVDDASADYFRWRDLDGDRIVKARSPAMEAAERRGSSSSKCLRMLLRSVVVGLIQ